MADLPISVGADWIDAKDDFARELKLDVRDGRVNLAYCWAEEPLDNQWTIAFQIINQSGNPVVGEIRLFPRESYKCRPVGQWSAKYRGTRASVPYGGIRSSVVKKLPMSRLRSRIGKTMASILRDQSLLTAIGFDNLQTPRKPGEQSSRLGRPRLADKDYAELAAFYCDRYASGSRTPVQDAAKHFHVDESIIRNRLHKARQFEFLTGGTHGQAQGQLTEKSKNLLKGAKRGQKG